jgi:Helix-turn-helix.
METYTFSKLKVSEAEKSNFRLWLQRQLTDRCKRNPRYSLRAFAKSLEVDPSTLSQILSGKRSLTKRSIRSFTDRIGASPEELQEFGLLSGPEQDGVAEKAFQQVALDTFSVMAEWYHYAILELTYVDGFQASARWISHKLGITAEEAKAAIERLQRLGLLLVDANSMTKSARHLTNQSSVNTSAAHRELQRQVIEKALLAVDECIPSEKDITSMTMAIDETKMDQARDMIRKFRRELCALMEDGKQTRVFNLTVQLYPLSKTEECP